MTHPSELELSMYADGALPDAQVAEIASHAQTCDVCRTRLDALSGDVQQIRAALVEDDAQFAPSPIPKFARPTSLRNFAIANILTALLIWLAQFLWKTIFGELVMNAATWVTSVYAPDIYELASSTALYYLEEGTAMFDAYFGLIVVMLTLVTALGLVLYYRKSRGAANFCLFALVGGAMLAPLPADALELRRSESMVAVAETETIDDTLMAAAETVQIKGHVSGDLVAVGRRIEVLGSVGGNVVAFGEFVEIRGTVGGFVLSAGSSVVLTSAQVGGDLWGAGENVRIDAASQVSGNAMMSGQNATIQGPVGRDVYAFAETVEVNARVGADLEAAGRQVRLLENAHVLGQARFRVNSEDSIEQADGARIDGGTELLDLPEELEPENPYATLEFYLWQIAKIISALLVGLVLLWLFPGLRNVEVGRGMDGVKTAGLGLLTLAVLPGAAVFLAVTLIGLPFAFAAIAGWIALLYLAKVIVGVFVGSLLLGERPQAESSALVLLAGMTAIIVVINIPLLGGIFNFVLTIIGAGLLVQYVYTSRSAA